MHSQFELQFFSIPTQNLTIAISCFFLFLGPTILQYTFQIISTKIEGMTAVIAIYRVDITYPPSYEGGSVIIEKREFDILLIVK